MTQYKKVILITFSLGAFLAIWAFLIEPGLLTQKYIRIEKWSGPPLRIAFFSDLHAGAPHITKDYIKKLVQRINAKNPDVILIGGDLVIDNVLGGQYIPIAEIVGLLKELKAPLGVYAVLGNHDWWNDGNHITKVLEDSGIAVLDNKAKSIKMNSDFSFWLVGIGDDYTHHAKVGEALAQVTSDAPKILFMHDPGALLQVKQKFQICLAGHLHGGQVFIPGIGAIITPGDAPKDWASGWVDFEFGSLYVSKGVGTSILPVRFNALPEFVVLDLNPKP